MNSKKLLAFALATTMVFGSCLTVMAADNDTTTGTGTTMTDYADSTIDGAGTAEGIISTHKYRVVLPVIPASSLNYTIDPQGLVKATAGKKYGESVTVGDGNVFFKNHETLNATTEGTVTGVSGASDEFSVVNKSSFPITVTIKTKATAGTTSGTTLAPSLSTTATPTGTSIAIGLKDNAKNKDEAKLLTGTDQELATNLGDASAAYSFNYASQGGYTYDFDSTGEYAFATYKFNYEAAIPEITAANIDAWTIQTAATATTDAVLYATYTAPTISVVYKLAESNTTASDYAVDIAGPDAASTSGGSGESTSGGSGESTTPTTTTVTFDGSMVPKMYKISLPSAATALSDITNLKVNGVAVNATDLNSAKNIVRVSKPDVRTALTESVLNQTTELTFTFTFGGVNYTGTVGVDG